MLHSQSKVQHRNGQEVTWNHFALWNTPEINSVSSSAGLDFLKSSQTWRKHPKRDFHQSFHSLPPMSRMSPECHLYFDSSTLLECGLWMALKCGMRATRRDIRLLQGDNHQASLLPNTEEKCLSQSSPVSIHAIQHRMGNHMVRNLWSKRSIYST